MIRSDLATLVSIAFFGQVQRMQAVAELAVQQTQPVQRAVDDGDVGAEADGDQRGIAADDAAAENGHPAGRNARDAAEQHARTPSRFLQTRRTDLDRHAAGDFAHRRQQRQAAKAVGDRFVSDGGNAGSQQQVGLARVGRQMQVGEQGLLRAQPQAFVGLRFLDLDDQLRPLEDFLRTIRQFGAGGGILLVAQANGAAGIFLHDDRMPVPHQFADAARRHADAVFVILDFFRNAYQHVLLLDWSRYTFRPNEFSPCRFAVVTR